MGAGLVVLTGGNCCRETRRADCRKDKAQWGKHLHISSFCCSLLGACRNFILLDMKVFFKNLEQKGTFLAVSSNSSFSKLCQVPQNVCRRLPTPPLPGVHHRPFHGVPASRSSETVPQHAAVDL